MPFLVITKKIKYLEINLTRNVLEIYIYEVNSKILMKVVNGKVYPILD